MKKILLISIGCNYKSSSYQLNGCINDAIDISHTFVEGISNKNFDVKLDLLTDTSSSNYPSKINILNKLKNAILATNRDIYDSFIFYFAGHGYQISDTNNDENDNLDEAILAADGELIKDDHLFQIISQLKSHKQAIFIFDCCHSGTMIDLNKISNKSFNKKLSSNILCISACSDHEKSTEISGRGLFTSSLCNLIRSRGIDSKINIILGITKRYLRNMDVNMSLTISSSKKFQMNRSSFLNIRSNNRKRNKTRGIHTQNKNNKPNINKRNINKRFIKDVPRKCNSHKKCHIPRHNNRKNSKHFPKQECKNNNNTRCIYQLRRPWRELNKRIIRTPH